MRAGTNLGLVWSTGQKAKLFRRDVSLSLALARIMVEERQLLKEDAEDVEDRCV